MIEWSDSNRSLELLNAEREIFPLAKLEDVRIEPFIITIQQMLDASQGTPYALTDIQRTGSERAKSFVPG